MQDELLAPSLYHITHVNNLPRILEDGALFSDAVMVARGGPDTPIGMSTIKLRRLKELRVKCHPDGYVGDYVPFFFCPRSIMLYLIYRGNHPELTYRGGQGPIMHLEADLHETVTWADAHDARWAFTLSNAGAAYTEFRHNLAQLGDVDWAAVANNDFTSQEVKEGKQAEFLIYERFPWELVRNVGVRSESVRDRVLAALEKKRHRPPVVVRPDWYF
ncbi:MAG: type II toxin-antitoxin system toxin DNA ADP-ribosyl transferase DarT [Solirubrobacteraceae bacterium]